MVSGQRSAHADSVACRGNFISARMICVMRACEIPSRRALSARDATSPPYPQSFNPDANWALLNPSPRLCFRSSP